MEIPQLDYIVDTSALKCIPLTSSDALQPQNVRETIN